MLLRVRPSCSQLNSPVARNVRAGPKRTLAGQRPLLPHLNLLGFESHWRHTKPEGEGYMRRRDFKADMPFCTANVCF